MRDPQDQGERSGMRTRMIYVGRCREEMGRGNIPEAEKNSTAVEKICLRLAFSKQRFLKVLAIMFDRWRC